MWRTRYCQSPPFHQEKINKKDEGEAKPSQEDRGQQFLPHFNLDDSLDDWIASTNSQKKRVS